MSAAPETLQLALAWSDWLNLFGHFLLLSMMSIGGAISTSSEMHRFLVEQRWRLPLLAMAAGVVIWRTRLHLLWVLAAGALLGAFGLV